MSSVKARLAVLQFADSFFPSGSISFSWGLEGLADSGAVKSWQDVEAFMKGQLHGRWGPFDRAVVIAAHRASPDLAAVAAIDNQVDIQTPSSESRAASCRLGSAMLSVFSKLGADDAAAYRCAIAQGPAHGHLSVMQGFLWSTVGLSLEEAVTISAHTQCVTLLSAAIRLGCLTHIEAQLSLERLRDEVDLILEEPACEISQIASSTFESEIAIMRHARNASRMFAN